MSGDSSSNCQPQTSIQTSLPPHFHDPYLIAVPAFYPSKKLSLVCKQIHTHGNKECWSLNSTHCILWSQRECLTARKGNLGRREAAGERTGWQPGIGLGKCCFSLSRESHPSEEASAGKRGLEGKGRGRGQHRRRSGQALGSV